MEIYAMNNAHEKWGSVAAFAEKCPWRAGKYLAELMRGSAFRDWERVFAAFEDGVPVGFCTLTEKDELLPEYPYTPLIGFVFVDEAHRGKRISGQIIRAVLGYAKTIGYDRVYVMSGEKGLFREIRFQIYWETTGLYTEIKNSFS